MAAFSPNESAPARFRSQGALHLFNSKAKEHNSYVEIYLFGQAFNPT